MIYVSFDMILGAYLIGNMTALIVKGSRTERFRDKMKEVIRYMNRNKLGKEIREQIKGHLRLQYESSYTEASVLQDIPISIRAKVTTHSFLCFHPSWSSSKNCLCCNCQLKILVLQLSFLLHRTSTVLCYLGLMINVLHLQISQTLYKPYVESVPLFKGCSAEFIQQIVRALCFIQIIHVDLMHTLLFFIFDTVPRYM